MFMTRLCPHCGADISHSYEYGTQTDGWYCEACDEAWTLADDEEGRQCWIADRRKSDD